MKTNLVTILLAIMLASNALWAQEAEANPMDLSPKFGEENMGTEDRLIRLGIGVGLATWGGVLIADGNSSGYYVLGASLVPFITAALARCPLYYPFGIDTRSKQSAIILPTHNGMIAAYSLAF